MNESMKNLLTPFEIACILIAIVVDINSAILPNILVDIAKQDAWISAMLGVAYPLYVALIAIYISKRHPNHNILVLSKKYLGNVVGNILNFLFFLSIATYLPAAMSNAKVMLRTYIVSFMSSFKIYVVLAIIGGYAAYKGLKVISRVCIANLFIVLAMLLGSIMIIKYGSYLNITPIMQTEGKNILKASTLTIYDYALFEVIFLLYPLINNHKKIKSLLYKSIGFVCLVYTWVVFITMYYLGPDLIKKTIWGFFTAAESIRFKVVNSFRYIFIFLWIFIAIKCIVLFYYFCIFILSSINKKFDSKLTYIIIGVIAIIVTLKYYNERLGANIIIQEVVKFSVAYNLIYITLIAIIIFVKKDWLHEK